MVPFGKDKAFTLILFVAGFINIILAILLIPIWHESGMAAAVSISEAIVTLIMFIYLWVKQLNPFHNNSKEMAGINEN
jgi:O-antigen/teichoic acid export membrane protein